MMSRLPPGQFYTHQSITRAEVIQYISNLSSPKTKISRATTEPNLSKIRLRELTQQTWDSDDLQDMLFQLIIPNGNYSTGSCPKSTPEDLQKLKMILKKGGQLTAKMIIDGAGSGNLPLNQELIKIGIPWLDLGLMTSARFGHKHIFQIYYDQVSPEFLKIWNFLNLETWSQILLHAIQGGHLDIISQSLTQVKSRGGKLEEAIIATIHIQSVPYFELLQEAQPDFNCHWVLSKCNQETPYSIIRSLILKGAKEWYSYRLDSDQVLDLFQTNQIPRDLFQDNHPRYEIQIQTWFQGCRQIMTTYDPNSPINYPTVLVDLILNLCN